MGGIIIFVIFWNIICVKNHWLWNVKYKIIVDRKEAIEYALSIANVDDIILLAGKGHETNTIIGDKKYPLDERQIVYDYLRDL